VVVALVVAGPSQRTLPMQMYTGTGILFDLVIAAAATVMFVAGVLMMIVVAIIRRRDTLSAARQRGE
jgi:putative spermidine/putrescine transport system permease protein